MTQTTTRQAKSRVELYALPGRERAVAALGCCVHQRIQRHAHRSYVFGIIGPGGRRMELDNGLLELAPGSVFALHPGQVHACAPLCGQAQDYRSLALDPALLRQELGLTGPAFGVLLPQSLRQPLARVFQLLRCSAPAPEVRAALSSFLQSLAPLARPCPAGRAEPLHPAVAKALVIMEAEPDQPLTLARLSDRVHLSPHHLQRLFRRQMGLSPQEHLTALRVSRAAELSRQGVPLAWAAALCGFCDQSHLSRAFKRVMGVAPGSYGPAGRT